MVQRISFRTNTVATDVESRSTVINIENQVEGNREFRKPLWIGEHLQVNAMSIPVGGEIGIEVHPELDQFIKIESGRARVLLGESENEFNYERIIDEDNAVMIAANTWHNVVNLGDEPLKLFSIYAPPHDKD